MGAHRNISVSKNLLSSLYRVQGLKQNEIASELNCSRRLVYYFLNKYEIKKRTQSDCCIKYKRKKFDGTLLEKSYMLGFRTGDLHVKYLHPSKTTICVDMGCAINSSEIKIFNELFQKYGHISQCLDRSCLKLWVLLDPSFSFLIRKNKSIPKWIYKKKNLFFAFFSGYADAEGYFKLPPQPAINITSKDYKILKDIHYELKKLGFHPNLNYYKQSSTAFPSERPILVLTLRRKEEIKRASLELLPLSKHFAKREKMRLMQVLVKHVSRLFGENNPNWKGDQASKHAKYLREWERRRSLG